MTHILAKLASLTGVAILWLLWIFFICMWFIGRSGEDV